MVASLILKTLSYGNTGLVSDRNTEILSSQVQDLRYLALQFTTNKYTMSRLSSVHRRNFTRCPALLPGSQSGESSEATCRECGRQPLQLPATFTATRLCSCQLSPTITSHHKCFTSLIPHQVKSYLHVSVKCKLANLPSPCG